MTIKALVADVGGTNIRLAIANLDDFSMASICTYQCANFNNIDEAISQYFNENNVTAEYACIDVATAVVGDQISLTNNHWSFSQQAIKQKFGFKQLILINDFTAIAMSVPHISSAKKVQIGGAAPQENKPIAIYGAGTGLGVAHLVHTGEKWLPLAGEGGHVDFAPIDADEVAVLAQLQKKYARVSAEQLLSGLGLVQIYQSLQAIAGNEVSDVSPAYVSTSALDNSDAVAVKTLQMFCRILGSFGGNLALTLTTFGGVYIAGGVVPRFIDYVKTSDFRRRFDAKGRFSKLVETIPVYIVTEDQPGLIGCAAYLKQEL